MKILITGGLGFIGSNFIQYELSKHDDVRIANVDNLSYGANVANTRSVEKNPRYSFTRGDITDRDLIARLVSDADVVINFAAQSHVDRSIADPLPFMKSNTEGTLSILDALRRGRGDEAKCDVTRAIHLVDQFDGFMPWYEVETRILIARASIGLADVATARASLSHASRVLRRISDAPEFHAWLDDGWADIDEHSASALTGPASLTIAELRILRFLPTHLSFREIGERLHVSTNTVKTQAHAVYRKLDASSRSGAVARARDVGLVDG